MIPTVKAISSPELNTMPAHQMPGDRTRKNMLKRKLKAIGCHVRLPSQKVAKGTNGD